MLVGQNKVFEFLSLGYKNLINQMMNHRNSQINSKLTRPKSEVQ